MKIVFIGPNDTARAPMALAYARKHLPEHFSLESVGLVPGDLDPLAVQVMHEVGLDISDHEPRHIDAEHIKDANLIVFVSLKRGGLSNSKIREMVWPIPDPGDGPHEQVLSQFRDTRTAIEKHVISLSRMLEAPTAQSHQSL